MMIGRPLPSQTACSLEFNPPFVRPVSTALRLSAGQWIWQGISHFPAGCRQFSGLLGEGIHQKRIRTACVAGYAIDNRPLSAAEMLVLEQEIEYSLQQNLFNYPPYRRYPQMVQQFMLRDKVGSANCHEGSREVEIQPT